MDASEKRVPDQQSDKLAAALTVAAKQHGLTRIDHATLSDDATRTYAVQGELHSPLKRIVEVSTQHAVATSIEQSTAALASIHSPHQPLPTRDLQPTVSPTVQPHHP
jgi:putative chitinase